MNCIVDTSAWIEYLIGSDRGRKLREIMHGRMRLITLECTIAELRCYCLRHNVDYRLVKGIVKMNSVVLPITEDTWESAANIRHSLRRHGNQFGLFDGLILAKQKELKCRLLSCDEHFKGQAGVTII